MSGLSTNTCSMQAQRERVAVDARLDRGEDRRELPVGAEALGEQADVGIRHA